MIEPLETRIAPASLHLIAFNFTDSASNTKTGQSLQFINAANPGTDPANIAIAKTVGGASNVYFIKVSAGEDLQVYTTTTGAADLINVSQGTVVAFFTDTNANNVATDTVLASEVTGLAVGNKVSAVVSTGVSGDVVTNYNDSTGMLGGTFGTKAHPGVPEGSGDATMLLPNTITKLTIAGPITGDFVAGSTVSSLQVTGSVNEILSGSAANGHVFSFDPTITNTTGDTTLNVPLPAARVAAPTLSNVIIDSATAITMGTGGAGAKGGSINGLTLLEQTNGIVVTAGAGGAGTSARTTGGAGGTINNVTFNGPLPGSPTLNPNSLIDLVGGAGGNGLATAAGGAGGAVTDVHVDYTLLNGVYTPNSSYLPDNITIQGGNGGTGGIAGAGGSLTNINILAQTPHDALTPGVPEFQLLGGVGGSSTLGGKGGAGGSITTLDFVNYALPDIDPTTGHAIDTVATSPTLTIALIQAGAGGSVNVKGAGGAGGSVNGLTLEGYNFSVIAGAGGNGVSGGGAGGAVSTVTVLGSAGSLPGDNFHTESLYVATGAGGNGSLGKGGAGGALKTLTVQNADFGTSSFNGTNFTGTTGFEIVAGSGGTAGKGAGGAGGSITGVQVTEVDFATDTYPAGLGGTVSIVAGNGGNAPVSGGIGGAGGSITTAVFVGEKVDSSIVTAGSGGSGGTSSFAGRGGAGGSITGAAISNAENALPSTTTPIPGILEDTTANFVTDGVVVGDPIENSVTGASTTVLAIVPSAGTTANPTASTELILATDIFAAGDGYVLPNESDSGTAQDPGLVLTDTAATFTTHNVTPGDTITDTTTGLSTTVSSVVSQTELILSKNIFTAGDKYKLPAENITGTNMGPGILTDTNANFVNNNVMAGDTITDTTTGLGTTVVSVVSPTQLILAENIFTAGDKYKLPTENITGTDMAGPGISQDTITDAAANFGAEGVVVGDTVQDITDGLSGTIIAVTPTQLTLLATPAAPGDISHFNPVDDTGDQYTITNVASSLGSVAFTGGNGGAGFATGAGGAGGSISDSIGTVPGSVTFTGGTGGNGGATVASGAGGSLVHDGAITMNGSGLETAGSAGSTGAKLAKGGSISSADVQAAVGVSLVAGSGSNGGAGGSVSASGYSGAPGPDGGLSLTPPTGNITIEAGNGGASPTGVGGAGGAVTNVKGFISSGDGFNPYTTEFMGGAGGNGVTKGGAGGSVNTVDLHGGGGTGVTFFINAGDAGNASAGKTGATGGSVLNIGAGGEASSSGNPDFSVSPDTDFHHISAGNGGNAIVKGGLGGSVTDVFTNATIGVRTGAMFGFNLAGAGGISAGAGGTGATAGLAGNVTNITADAIASIVAGHISTGQGLELSNLADKVDSITLTGAVAPSTVQQFTLSFNGQTTVSLPTNATPLEVGSALNALASISSAGGVSVAQGSNGYVITFITSGAGAGTNGTNTISALEPSPALTTEATVGNAATSTPEVQNVQVIASDTFSLTFDGQTTGPLTISGNAAADAAAVKAALDGLTSLHAAANNVAVTAVEGTATTNPVFTVTFSATGGPEPLIVPNMLFGESTTGTTHSADVQTITFPTRGDLIPSQLATANFVGSIYNPVRFNATVFDYSNFPAPFAFGDVPIDGLIAATDLTGVKNFFPEAYVTASGTSAVLVDNTQS
jgi:hypothetical protein